MYKQHDSCNAIDIVEEHKQSVHEQVDKSLIRPKAPPMGMLSLLEYICSLTLSIDEHEEYLLHHIVYDQENYVPRRHTAALVDSVRSISDLTEVHIELQIQQTNHPSGIIIPEPPKVRTGSGIDTVRIPAPLLVNRLFETTSGQVDPSLHLRHIIGAILALQALIEESDNAAFMLMIDDAKQMVHNYNFFKQSIQAMEVIIRNIADINGVSADIIYD